MSNQLRKSDESDVNFKPERLKTLMQGFEDSYPRHLAEQFPRIANNLINLWNEPREMMLYLDKLLFTDRPNRQGFPKEVANELFILSRIYEKIYFPSKSNDIWGLLSTRPS